MNALVVHESMYGNTEEIACAIAEGLAEHTRVVPVELLTDEILAGVDFLVIGGPTHAHGMSRPATRTSAQQDGATNANVEVGVRDRIPSLGRRDIAAATFDTRIDKPRVVTGAASKGIAKLLHRCGYSVVVAPESFLVAGTTGPLVAGELERARGWGQSLRARLEASSSVA